MRGNKDNGQAAARKGAFRNSDNMLERGEGLLKRPLIKRFKRQNTVQNNKKNGYRVSFTDKEDNDEPEGVEKKAAEDKAGGGDQNNNAEKRPYLRLRGLV